MYTRMTDETDEQRLEREDMDRTMEAEMAQYEAERAADRARDIAERARAEQDYEDEQNRLADQFSRSTRSRHARAA